MQRPFRYSLRSLFVAMLFLGAGLGTFGRVTSTAREQHEVTRRLTHVVGNSEHFLDYPPPDKSPYEEMETRCRCCCGGPDRRWQNPLLWYFGIDVTPNHPVVAWGRAPDLEGHDVGVLDRLEVLVLTEAGDDDLARLARLKDLRFLILPDYRGTAAGLRSLARLERLGQLSISGPLGAEELEALGSAPKLFTLSIDLKQVRLADEGPIDEALVTKSMKRAERGLPECTVRVAIGPHF